MVDSARGGALIGGGSSGYVSDEVYLGSLPDMQPHAQRPARLDVAASAVSDRSRRRARLLLPGVPLLAAEEAVAAGQLVVLAVPDAVLPDIVRGLTRVDAWQAGQIVVHTSPRYGTGVLEPALGAHILPIALHPAMRFSGAPVDLERLPDARFAVTCAVGLRPIGEALAIEMGGEPVWVSERARAQYAAAVAHAVAPLSVIVDQAAELLSSAQIPGGRSLLATLMLTSLETALREADDARQVGAFTDLDALRADLDTLHDCAPDSRAVHLAVARAAAARAMAAGHLSHHLDDLLDLLTTQPGEFGGD